MNTIDKAIRAEKEELKKSKKNRKNKKKIDNKDKKIIKIKNIFSTLFLLGSIGIFTFLVLLYGPWSNFRDWLITSAMTTMNHQYLATWFFDDKVINNVLNNNKVFEIEENTNLDLIQSVAEEADIEIPTTFENDYERQILQRDSKNNDYKIIEINGRGYNGYLVAIYNPSRIQTVATKYLGSSGQYLTKMAEENDALVAINAGGFDDANFEGTGGSPLGITISNGKYLTQRDYSGTGGLVGFTRENKLICGKYTVSEAQKLGVRDGVTFGPFLIVNGEPAKVRGNGGWGTAPRSAIGQRKDGVVLFLVINGRTATCPGATMNDLIEIMQKYGAYNACNLDGGTSSALVINNTIVNDPIDSSGNHRTRPVSTCFILKKDSSDDSDHTVVKEKLK